MDEYKRVTIEQIEAGLVGEPLRMNRIMSLALVMGTTLFLAVVLYIYQKNLSSDIEISYNAVDELIVVFLILALIIYPTFLIFPKIFLKGNKLETKLLSSTLSLNNISTTDPVINIISLDRTMMIIRLAMLEGVALFGLVALMLCVNSGLIYHNDNYWLLVIPLFIQAIATSSFVSKEKIVSRIERDILFRIKTENY